MYFLFFFFKQKTAYEMRISDWSSDVCSADLQPPSLAITGFDERHCIFRANAKATDLDYTHRSLTPLFNAKIFAKRLGQRLAALRAEAADRKSVVLGKSVYVRVDIGGRRIIKKKKCLKTNNRNNKQRRS